MVKNTDFVSGMEFTAKQILHKANKERREAIRKASMLNMHQPKKLSEDEAGKLRKRPSTAFPDKKKKAAGGVYPVTQVTVGLSRSSTQMDPSSHSSTHLNFSISPGSVKALHRKQRLLEQTHPPPSM